LSVEVPKMAIAFGQYGIPQGDVIECRVHLGCTREVSSFDLLLQNWDGKYSPNGSIPLAVGADGSIHIGRGANVPQIITCRIESIKYESSPSEHYVRVSGRCWGERLFRRVFTGTFVNQKGEDIVKYLLNYAGVPHTRGETELVEETDTTYTWLEYENTPVWDIIKYIAESADKEGVVGFDFRVAPDGKFEFFPRNSKTSPVSLSEKVEVCEFRRDIYRIRNRILVLGANEKKLPSDADEDGLTESVWGAIYAYHNVNLSSDHVAGDGEVAYADSYSVHVYPTADASVKNATGMYRVLGTTRFRGPAGFKKLRFWLKWNRDGSGDPSTVKVYLKTDWNNYYYKEIRPVIGGQGEWRKITLSLEEYWAPYGSPDWNNIDQIAITIEFSEECNPHLWVDHLVFEDCRFSATQEDMASQNAYGLRELTETDEELYSDNECLLRAKALLAYLKDPVEYVTLRSAVIDYGNTPVLPGDKIYVNLPNENVSGYYRIISVEYRVDAKTQTLETALELGKEIPLLADYLYGLRSTTVTVEKLARTKISRGFIPPVSRAYSPAHHSHNASDIAAGVLAEERIPTVFTVRRYFNGGITMGASLNMNSRSILNVATISQCMPPAADEGAVGTTSQYWNCVAANSVWYKALGQFDALDDLALIKRFKTSGKTDGKGVPLVDSESLPPEVTENGLINAGHLMGLLIGAVKQLAARVEALEKRLGEG
jgi:hypothetical protein